MVNEGISEKVAMTITGHKTRSVFDRYNIVSPVQLQEAAPSCRRSRFRSRSGEAAETPLANPLENW